MTVLPLPLGGVSPTATGGGGGGGESPEDEGKGQGGGGEGEVVEGGYCVVEDVGMLSSSSSKLMSSDWRVLRRLLLEERDFLLFPLEAVLAGVCELVLFLSAESSLVELRSVVHACMRVCVCECVCELEYVYMWHW